jgi:hypothetical protein
MAGGMASMARTLRKGGTSSEDLPLTKELSAKTPTRDLQPPTKDLPATAPPAKAKKKLSRQSSFQEDDD